LDINRLARIVALCLSGIVLTACRGTQGMDIQAIAYNKAVADSTNQFFLLNTLRARDRFPLYYSRTTGNTASASLSPSLTLGLDGNNLSPSATIGSSLQNNLSLANLDDQKFMRGVLTPVPLAIMEAYYGQRWPKEVLAMMFIKDIVIDRHLVDVLTEKFDRKCADSTAPYCQDRLPQSAQSTPSTELSSCMSGRVVEFSGKDALFDNYPPDPNALKCFQSLLRVLLALGLAPADGPKYSVIIPDLPASRADLPSLSAAIGAKLSVSKLSDSDDYAVCSMRGVSGFTLDQDALTKNGTAPGILSRVSANAVSKTGQDGGLRIEGAAAPQGATSLIAALPKNCAAQVAANNAEKLRAARCAIPANQHNDECQDPPDFNITTRSLDSMLYYLGEDLRAGSNVKIWADHGPGRYLESSLYVAKSTTQSRAGDALVSVDYRDETYAIDSCPQDLAGDPCLGRSLQVLSMLNQIWGLQKEATDTPSVPVVSIVNDR